MSCGVRSQPFAANDRALDRRRTVQQRPSDPSEGLGRLDGAVRGPGAIGGFAQIIDDRRGMAAGGVHLPAERRGAGETPSVLELGEPPVRLIGDRSRGVQRASVERRAERGSEDPHVVIDRVARNARGCRHRRVDRGLGLPHAPGLDLVDGRAEQQLRAERVVLLQERGHPSFQDRRAPCVAGVLGVLCRSDQQVDRVDPIRVVRRGLGAEQYGRGEVRPGRAGPAPPARTRRIQLGPGETDVGLGGRGRRDAGRGRLTHQRVDEPEGGAVRHQDPLVDELVQLPFDVCR